MTTPTPPYDSRRDEAVIKGKIRVATDKHKKRVNAMLLANYRYQSARWDARLMGGHLRWCAALGGSGCDCGKELAG